MPTTKVPNGLLTHPVNHNILINPSFTVNQRGNVIVAGSSTDFSFVSDRWTHRPANLVGSGYQVEPVIINGQGNGLNIIYSSPTSGPVFLQQFVEAINVYPLYAKQVTVSFNINNNSGIDPLANTLIDVNIWKKDQQAIVCTPIGDVVNIGGTRYSQTFEVGTMSDANIPDPSERGMSLRIHPTMNGGLREWKLWNVKMEVGSVATPFIARPYSEELDLCRRYYEEQDINSASAVRATIAGSGAVVNIFNVFYPKRAAPSVTFDGMHGSAMRATTEIDPQTGMRLQWTSPTTIGAGYVISLTYIVKFESEL
jgi:hypothetical protein